MEKKPAQEGAYSETFGIEPWVFERDVPETIKALAPALQRFEHERGSDDEIRERFASVYPRDKIDADLQKVHRQLRDAIEEFRRGRFHFVEYFMSDTDDERPRGRVAVPRVVLGASFHAITRAARVYGQWRRHSAVGSAVTKAEALERLRYSDIGGQLYEQLIHQMRSAYDLIKQLLDATDAAQTVRREFLRTRGRYLHAVQRALEQGYLAWKKARDEYVRHHEDIAPELTVPSNSVLDAILEGTPA
ncbi:MAG: hypothetical protein IT406_02915 [Candidatus Yanofskybacteria bacterium]|nr:hypothetical protein [Candidatus Yanofskybacteria bacterium]